MKTRGERQMFVGILGAILLCTVFGFVTSRAGSLEANGAAGVVACGPFLRGVWCGG